MRPLARRALGPVVLAVVFGGVFAPGASAVPVCGNNNHTVESGQPITLSLSCTGDGPVTGSIISNPSRGTLAIVSSTSVTYTSNANYCGPDQFRYSASDASSSATYTSYLDVRINNVPCAGTVNQPPSCSDVSIAVESGSTIPLPSLCSDPEGDPVTSFAFADGGAGAPDHGTIPEMTPPFTYTPHAGYTGTDEIRFVAGNSGGTSPVAVISILVTEPGGSAYLAAGDSFTAPPDTLTPGTTLTTSITSPVGGLVGVLASANTTTPSGYVLMGQQIEIVAPDASEDAPLNITFKLEGAPAGAVTVIRDGVAVDRPCDLSTAAANPDPCFLLGPTADNTITVRTSHASDWGVTLAAPSFRAPLDGGALNLAKSGRVVPVKLTLGGAVETVNLSRLVARTTCDTEDSDVVETYAPAGSSNIGNAFRYDALAGHWIYNLSTKGLLAGKCYRGYVSSHGVEVGHFDIQITA